MPFLDNLCMGQLEYGDCSYSAAWELQHRNVPQKRSARVIAASRASASRGRLGAGPGLFKERGAEHKINFSCRQALQAWAARLCRGDLLLFESLTRPWLCDAFGWGSAAPEIGREGPWARRSGPWGGLAV